MMRYREMINDGTFEYLCHIRRKIHQWPEPAFQEAKTAETVSVALSRLSIWHKTGVGKTGVVARLETTPSGPTIAIRADMDALPVEEKTGLPFSSKVSGYMHACGHDGHIAMLIGAAMLLKESPPEGNVVFIFQPAEEGGGGARAMIEAGVLDGVDMIFGGHIDMHFPVGSIAIRQYMDTSYTDSLEIRIIGKGGHAARPHETVDAVVVGAQIVTLLQTIVSRSVDPLNPTVVSIGSFHAGTAYNAIADEAVLRGTIRCTDKRTRDIVIEKIKKTAASVSSLHGAEVYVSIHEGYPPVMNHPEGYRIAKEAAKEVIGEDGVIILTQPSMGGEDFAYYLEHVPGCFVRFGAHNSLHKFVPTHSSNFDFDEEVIRVGAAFYAEVVKKAVEVLKHRNVRV